MTREEAIEKLKSYDPMSMMPALQMAIKALKAQPKTGKWIPQKGGGCCCSECGRYALDEVDGNFIHVSAKSKYCPHCGVMMLKEGDDHD